MFTDFEYADKRLSDFGWVAGHIGENSGVTEIDIGCDITFNTVKNNHSSIHYVSSTSYDNICTPPSWDIFKDPCGKNQEDMYVTNNEVSALTKWLNRHGYRKFKPLYHSDDSDVHYYGSFNVKKKTINDRVVGLVITFNSNAPYGFGEQIVNEIDMKNNEVTVSGENVYITDCAAVPPANIELFGKSTQKTYEGNQLFDETLITDRTAGGITTSKNEGGGILISGTSTDSTRKFFAENIETVLEPGTYTFSMVNQPSGMFSPRLLDADGNYYNGTFTIEESVTIVNGYFNIDGNGQVFNNIVYLMLNEGTTALPWEPYVGGEQSPNMFYPQRVERHGESGEINQGLYGGNLVDQTKATITNSTKNIWINNAINISYAIKSDGRLVEIPFVGKSGETYYISYNVIKNNSSSDVKMYFPEISHYVNGVQSGKNSKKITLVGDVTKVVLYIDKIAFVEGTEILITDFIISASDIPYELYTEQLLTLVTPNGLGGIPLGQTIPTAIQNSAIHMSGVYWDEIEQRYYIADTKNENSKDVQRVARKVFDGTETFLYLQTAQGNLFRHGTRNYITALQHTYQDDIFCMCNYYQPVREPNRTNGTVSGIYRMDIDFIDDRFSDIASFKEELARLYAEGNPVYVDYIIAEPIVNDLTQEEIDQYNSLVMNYPTTTIVNDAGAYMKVTYLQDYDNEFIICGDSDEYTTLYPNISITCKRDGDLRIKNTLTENVFEVLNCSKDETIYVNGEHKYIDSDNKNHKETTLFNDFNYNYLDVGITEDDFNENIYETSMPCKITIDYSPIRKVGI